MDIPPKESSVAIRIVEHEEAVWGGFTHRGASIIPVARRWSFFVARLDERINAPSTVAQFGYERIGILRDLDRKCSDFRMDNWASRL